MKKIIIAISFISLSMMANASLQDGIYLGISAKTGLECKVKISIDGDYLYSGRTEYRLTVHRKGPMIDCKDYSGREYSGCASGAQTNGNQKKSIFMLLSDSDDIQKIYFNDNDTDSTNDRECIDFRKD